MRRGLNSRDRLATALGLTAALGLAGCEAQRPVAPELDLGSLDMSACVVIGNSLSAGVVNGGLGGRTQQYSFPALIAAAAGVGAGFEQPTITDPGIPAKRHLITTPLGPAIITCSGTGTPINMGLTRSYNNLAVPGATSIDILNDDGGASSASPMAQLILWGLGTQRDQAIALNPTLVFVWMGNNDVLGGAVAGRIIDFVTTISPTWTETQIQGVMQGLAAATSAYLVIATIPDVTAIPYVTYLTRGRTSPLTDAGGVQIVFPVITTGLGAVRQATVDDFILLPAAVTLATDSTYGTPAHPLSDADVLDQEEVIELQTRILFDNTVIQSWAEATGAAVVDVYTFFNELSADPVMVVEGGIDYGLDGLFVSDGGMAFSLDGVHPSTAGYVVLANYFIDRLNQEFDAAIPHVSFGRTLMPKVARGAAKIPLDRMPDFRPVREQLLQLFGIRPHD